MIGWREDALKMVFLVTDQNYHITGDGRVRTESLSHAQKFMLLLKKKKF